MYSWSGNEEYIKEWKILIHQFLLSFHVSFKQKDIKAIKNKKYIYILKKSHF